MLWKDFEIITHQRRAHYINQDIKSTLRAKHTFEFFESNAINKWGHESMTKSVCEILIIKILELPLREREIVEWENETADSCHIGWLMLST